MSRDTTSSAPRGSTGPPKRTRPAALSVAEGAVLVRAHGRGQQPDKPAASIIRCSGSASRGGAVLAQLSRSRIAAVARRPRGRGRAGVAGAPQCSRWRWRRPALGGRMRPRSKRSMSSCGGRCRSRKAALAKSAASQSREDGDWELSSRPRLADDPLTLHAVARLATAGEFQPRAAVRRSARRAARKWTPPRSTPWRRGSGSITAAGSAPCAGSSCSGGDEALAHLDPSVIDEPLAPYIVHPALLDGALQALLALIADQPDIRDLDGVSFLPWRFGRVRFVGPVRARTARARLRVTRIGTRSASADIALYDDAGAIVGELSECWFRRVELTRRAAARGQRLRIDLVPAPLRRGQTRRRCSARSPTSSGRCAAAPPDAAARDRKRPAARRADRLGGAASAARSSSMPMCRSRSKRSSRPALIVADARRRCSTPCSALLRRFGAASEDDRRWTIARHATTCPTIGEVWRLLLAEAPGSGCRTCAGRRRGGGPAAACLPTARAGGHLAGCR